MSGHADTIRRAEGIVAALAREQVRESEPWLTPASFRVLADDALALVAENQQLRDALERITVWVYDDTTNNPVVIARAALDGTP